MNKPLRNAGFESGAELARVPRYVIVRTFSGYQFAPENLEPAESGSIAGVNDGISVAACAGHQSSAFDLIRLAAAIFIGLIASAAIVAGLLAKIAVLIP